MLLVYAPTVTYGLFQDDYLLARPWGFDEVLRTFYGPFDPTNMNQAYFRPLASLSFALEWMVWHTHGWGYHLTNIILHTLVGVGLSVTLRSLRAPWWAALLGAAYFVVVPSNAATVVYIAERTDAMVALAILIGINCLLFYAGTRRRVALVYLNLAYVVALLCKEVAVAMVPVAAVFWLFLNTQPKQEAPVEDEGPVSLPRYWARDVKKVVHTATERSWLHGLGWVLGPLLATTVIYLIYRNAVLPPGAFLQRFHEGLAPTRAFIAAVHGTFKGEPWQIAARTELPLLATFALGLLAAPRASGWRLVALGLGCIVAGVIPVTFNGGVEPRLFYVAELGMGIAVAGLAMVYATALESQTIPWRRHLVGAALGGAALVAVAAVGSSQNHAQAVFAPDGPVHVAGDLRVWTYPTSARYVPSEQLSQIAARLHSAGLIDEQGHLTAAGARTPHDGHAKP